MNLRPGRLETRRLLERLYPESLRPRRTARFFFAVAERVRRRLWQLMLAGLLVAAWGLAHLYYYNRLVDLEWGIAEAWAQVEAQWLRRYHVQQSITKLVLAYAKHERRMLIDLTKMRTGQPGPKPALPALPAPLEKLGARELNRLFPQIQVTAEQYPALRASENFQQFSRALIDIEDQITKQIMAYNRRVNSFSTVLQQFPGNIFGRVCGFKARSFYVPERGEVNYRPVEVRVDG